MEAGESGMTDENPYLDKVENLIDTLDSVEDEMRSLTEDIGDLADNPLDDEDLVNVLWGRKHSRTKTETRDALNTLRDIEDMEERTAAIRLIAAFSDMTIEESREFMDDLKQLRERYGGEDDG